jgi:RHS repeat-associated protein
VSNWNAGAASYELSTRTQFVYDGWRLLAELDATQNPPALLRSYVWGADLSSTLDGAGGVGGLLAMVDHAGGGATYFYAYDGNGNVRALVNAADGTNAAQYDYGPFGEPLRATGPMAKLNPFRWSTQYTDDETDFVMYARRPYSPAIGGFLSRDPIEEWGGLNLYGFVANNPANYIESVACWPAKNLLARAPRFCIVALSDLALSQLKQHGSKR